MLIPLVHSLKMNHNSGRDPNIVLRVAEETGLHQVTLYAPTDQRDQMIIQATTQRIRERSVRA